MLVFDLETTGLKKPDACFLTEQPRITEIYICKFDFKGRILDEIETFINPELPIPELITKLTGISDAMVENAPRFIEIYDQLVEFCVGEKTIFSHNLAFDMGVLRIELERHGLQYAFPYPPYQCCTIEASMAIQNRRLNLEKLYLTATGRQKETKHRAKDDVHGLIECICWLKKEGFIHDLFN